MIADPLWSCVMLLWGPLWVFCGSFVVLCGPVRYLVIPQLLYQNRPLSVTPSEFRYYFSLKQSDGAIIKNKAPV